jgi:hypothetical protein
VSDEIQRRFAAQARELQKRLSVVDLLIADSGRGHQLLLEHLVAKLGTLKLKMYREPGKKVPHIHVDYGREHHNAAYSFDPAILIEGSLAKSHDRVVVQWINDNRPALNEIWDSFQDEKDPAALIANLAGED